MDISQQGTVFLTIFAIHEYLVQSTSTVTVPLVVSGLGGGGDTTRVIIENGGQLHPEGSNQTGVLVTRGVVTVDNQGRIQATGTGHGIHATAGRVAITNNGIYCGRRW